MIKIGKRIVKHLKQLANSPCGVLELKNVTQKWDRVVQNLCQMMRVSAVQKVWKYFSFLVDENGAENKLFVGFVIVPLHIWETNLFYHLQANHPDEHSKIAPKKAVKKCESTTQATISGCFLHSKHILITHCAINNVRMRS